jgi:hypothetical protein
MESLSSGETKRVLLCEELTDCPPALLLDEPTSHLDSAAALQVARVLRRLADRRHTVLLTVHQPSAEVFATFDCLLLLARGGTVLYSGPAAAALAHFAALGLTPVAARSAPENLLSFAECLSAPPPPQPPPPGSSAGGATGVTDSPPLPPSPPVSSCESVGSDWLCGRLRSECECRASPGSQIRALLYRQWLRAARERTSKLLATLR